MNNQDPEMEVAVLSEKGRREENQDWMSWSRVSWGEVFIVADGMGGHKGGAQAAQMTVEGLEKHLKVLPAEMTFSEAIKEAVSQTNKDVHSSAHSGNPETENMGSTVVVLLVSDGTAQVAHVGDSRAYLFRKGQLKLLTKDHTTVQRMLDAGMITPEEARKHPDAHILSRAVGSRPEVEIEISEPLKLEEGDGLLLCSDGLTGYVEDQEIEKVLRSQSGAQRVPAELADLALNSSGDDNITVQFIQYGKMVPAVPEPDRTPAIWEALRRLPKDPLVRDALAISAVAVLAFVPFSIYLKAPPPLIGLVANPVEITSGETTLLEWKVQNARTVRIEPDVGEVQATGSRKVAPTKSVTYVVMATGPRGTVSSKVDVVVKPAVSAPSIEIAANPPVVVSGQPTVLEWKVQNAQRVRIEPDVGEVPATGSRQVAPTKSVTYVVTATGSRGTISKKVDIRVEPVPTIVLVAKPVVIKSGQPIRLEWKAQDAQRVLIEPGIGEVPSIGFREVTLTESVTYTATATGPGGTISKSVDIRVEPLPTIALEAKPPAIKLGETTVLEWKAQNAKKVRIEPDVGEVPATGTRQVSPTKSVTYTATATGPGGTQSSRINITVEGQEQPIATTGSRPEGSTDENVNPSNQTVQVLILARAKDDVEGLAVAVKNHIQQQVPKLWEPLVLPAELPSETGGRLSRNAFIAYSDESLKEAARRLSISLKKLKQGLEEIDRFRGPYQSQGLKSFAEKEPAGQKKHLLVVLPPRQQ